MTTDSPNKSEQVHREARFLLLLEAFTAMEMVEEEGSTKLDNLQQQFKAEKASLQYALRSSGEITEKEDMDRKLIAHDQTLCWNELVRAMELMRHGCSEDLVGYGDDLHEGYQVSDSALLPERQRLLSLIHPPSPKPEDTSWMLLPTMVEVDNSDFRLEKQTVRTTAGKLRSLDTSSPSLFDVSVITLMTMESRSRLLIDGEEATELSRAQREFTAMRRGLLEIEATIEDDVRTMTLLRLHPEERIAYLAAPLIAEEARNRALMEMNERERFQRVALVEEPMIREMTRTLCECQRIATQHAQKLRSSRLTTMERTAWATMAGSRFGSWLRWCRRKKNVHKRIPRIEAMGRHCAKVLILRYARRWRDCLVTPKRLLQQSAIQTEAALGYLTITVKEEEERQRNMSDIQELIERNVMIESFLGLRDSIKAEQQATSLEAMVHQSRALHQLSVISRWYDVVRLKRLQVRTNWLLQATQQKLMQRFMVMWMAAPAVVRVNRAVAVELSRGLLVQTKFAALSVEEEYRRFFTSTVEGEVRQMLLQDFTDGVLEECERLQTQRLEAMERRNAGRHARLRLQSWFRYAAARRPRTLAVCLMQRRNELALLRAYFSSQWRRRAQLQLQERRALAAESQRSNQQLALEEKEAFQRVVLAHHSHERWLIWCRGLFLQSPLAQRLSSLNSAAQSLSRAADGRLISRYLEKLSQFIFQRRRTKRLKDSLIPNLEKKMMSSLWARYMNHWRHAAAASVARKRQAKLLWSLPEQERLMREEVEGEQSASMTAIVDEERHSALKAQHDSRLRHVITLQHRNETLLIQRVTSRWFRRGARVANRRHALETVKHSSMVAHTKDVFSRWLHIAAFLRCRPLLLKLRNDAELGLMRRYFKRCQPHALRLAKVSRAKSNLERAQSAAKILAVGGPSEAAANGGSMRVVLPPLVSKPADAVKSASGTPRDDHHA